MKLARIDSLDTELVTIASELLLARFHRGRHHVAAALRVSSGATITGLHIGSRRVNVCAEQIALGTALSQGAGMPVACASVIMMTDADHPAVTSPCGVCRELLNFYNPDMTTLIALPDGPAKTWMSQLLPAPWVLPHEL
jgi:cytidine deaminase